jgi:hypothetical protein
VSHVALDGRAVARAVVVELGPEHDVAVLGEPLMSGRTRDVSSPAGTNLVPAASLEAGKPRKILPAGTDSHLFHACRNLF